MFPALLGVGAFVAMILVIAAALFLVADLTTSLGSEEK